MSLIKTFFLLFLLLLCLVGIIYAQWTPGIIAWNSGEFTPLLLMRSDFKKYNNAAKTLENMLIMSQGPVDRRSGTKYITDCNESRIIPFEYSKTDAYILQVQDERIYFFRETE